MSGMMQGKRGLIMGVANKNSIAWGIARACADAGAELAFTYQGEALEKRVFPLAESVGANIVEPCDVTDEASLSALFEKLKKEWGHLDFVVHAIAFAGKEELMGRYVDTSSKAFDMALNISCYSFTAVCRHAEPLMSEGGSLLTLSYYGAEKVIPHYNVMGVAKAALETSIKYLAVDMGDRGIRVNAISAGPMRTLAGAVINKSRQIYNYTINNSPIKKPLSLDDIGKSSVYLMSDLSKGVTGEILYVDNGYNNVGMSIQDLAGL